MQLQKRGKRRKWRKIGTGFSPPQQVNWMPSLSTYNCFDVLAIQQSNETIETVKTAMQIPESLPPSIPLLPQYPASLIQNGKNHFLLNSLLRLRREIPPLLS